MESVLWVVVFSAPFILVSMYSIPLTRPLVVRYWWAVVVLVLSVVGVILLRRKSGVNESSDGGVDDVAEAAITSVDRLVDHAMAESAASSARLSASRIKSESARARFEERIQVASMVSDSVERRKTLIKLMEEG